MYVFCISVPKDLCPFHHFFFHRKAPGHFDESSTRFWPLRLPTVMHHFAPNEKNVGKPLSKANLYLCLFVCFKGRLSPLPEQLVIICSIPHSRESPLLTPLRGGHGSET